MFAGIASFLFACGFIKSYSSEEKSEQKARQSARRHNTLYVDKWGNYRHGGTGKKYSIEDGKTAYNEFCIRQNKKEEENQIKRNQIRERWEIAEKIKKEYYKDYIYGKYNLSYEQWVLGTHHRNNYYYKKYKDLYTFEEILGFISYSTQNNLKKFK